MRIFNRILMALVFAALTAAGAFLFVYSFGLFGYSLSGLPLRGNLSGTAFYSGLEAFVRDVDGQSLTVLETVVLVVIALIGLALLIAELKPPRPRYLSVGDGLYTTRSTLEEEILQCVDEDRRILESSARVKPLRRGRARIRVEARMRRGEGDRSEVRRALTQAVHERIRDLGYPQKIAKKVKVDVGETDPRSVRRRVR